VCMWWFRHALPRVPVQPVIIMPAPPTTNAFVHPSPPAVQPQQPAVLPTPAQPAVLPASAGVQHRGAAVFTATHGGGSAAQRPVDYEEQERDAVASAGQAIRPATEAQSTTRDVSWTTLAADRGRSSTSQTAAMPGSRQMSTTAVAAVATYAGTAAGQRRVEYEDQEAAFGGQATAAAAPARPATQGARTDHGRSTAYSTSQAAAVPSGRQMSTTAVAMVERRDTRQSAQQSGLNQQQQPPHHFNDGETAAMEFFE